MLLSPWTMPNSDLGHDITSWKPLHTIPKLTAKRKKANPNAAKQAAAKRARKITRRRK